jgi:hypothetical protein
MRPRTKHINVNYNHFRKYVERKEINIHYISATDQPAEMMTQLLNETLMAKNCYTIMAWHGKSNIERECKDKYKLLY